MVIIIVIWAEQLKFLGHEYVIIGVVVVESLVIFQQSPEFLVIIGRIFISQLVGAEQLKLGFFVVVDTLVIEQLGCAIVVEQFRALVIESTVIDVQQCAEFVVEFDIAEQQFDLLSLGVVESAQFGLFSGSIEQ